MKRIVKQVICYIYLPYIYKAYRNALKYGFRYPFMVHTRKQLIDLVEKNKQILEIGPFDIPFLKGSMVKYFDVLDQKQLKERAIKMNRNPNGVPYIDYVSSIGDLSIVTTEKFTSVVSSHVIEHQVDLIRHLKDVSNLLNVGGKYYCIVPDKQFCFDALIPESNLAEVIVAHVEHRERHQLRSVIEHRCLTVHNNPWRHLFGLHGGSKYNFKNEIESAINEFNISTDYIDVHAWYFTVLSFENIIMSLFESGYIDMEIDMIYPTAPGQYEFFVIFKKCNSS